MKLKDIALEAVSCCYPAPALLIHSALILSLWPSVLLAQQAGHAPLTKSPALSFEEIVIHAFNNAPEILERDIRQQQAQSFQAIAGSWIVDRPNLVVSYLEDGALDDIGQREIEYAIQLQLRRPSERRSSRQLSDCYLEQVRAWEQALKLYITGKVRKSLADIAEAETLLNLEREATRRTEQLLEVTNKLFDAGEVSQLDVMQVDVALLNQQEIELKAEAMLVDAERSYEVLTGLHQRPSSTHRESLTDQKDVNHAHPQLVNLQSDINVAEADIQMTKANARGAPILSLGVSRQREDVFQQQHDALAVSLTIPFGAGKIMKSKTGSARRAKVDAEVAYLNTLRTLDLALHEVEHELFLTGEAILLSSQKKILSEKRWKMFKTAFIQGEVNLKHVIEALQEYQREYKNYQLLVLKKGRLITEFNQVIGIMP